MTRLGFLQLLFLQLIYLFLLIQFMKNWLYSQAFALREKCPNTELFLVRIFLYSVQIQENTDQR